MKTRAPDPMLFPNAKANARLIAAAPDLLAACACKMCGGAGYVLWPSDLSGEGGIAPCPEQCGDKRRAAIAKARGE